MNNTAQAFLRLLTIMKELRAKCPWDKNQTMDTLRPLTIEELYELTDCIANKDWKGIKEELGDVLLHIVFYTVMANEQQQFSIEDVLQGICDKLITRHPHVYGDIQINDEAEVKKNWERIKMKEGKKSVLEGVPKGLPSVIKAWRIQDKAAKIGFDWPDRESVWHKVEEEVQEMKEAVQSKNVQAMEEEMGDVLFSLINYSRFLDVDPDAALERTNRKFIQRIQWMEKAAAEKSIDLSDLSLAELEQLWKAAKMVEKGKA